MWLPQIHRAPRIMNTFNIFPVFLFRWCAPTTQNDCDWWGTITRATQFEWTWLWCLLSCNGVHFLFLGPPFILCGLWKQIKCIYFTLLAQICCKIAHCVRFWRRWEIASIFCLFLWTNHLGNKLNGSWTNWFPWCGFQSNFYFFIMNWMRLLLIEWVYNCNGRQRGNHNTMWPKMSLSPTDVKEQLTSIL